MTKWTSDFLADTPSQRVQFILEMQDGDEEHIPHHLFTELDELSFSNGQLQEWKETARLGRILRTPPFTLLSLLPTQFL